MKIRELQGLDDRGLRTKRVAFGKGDTNRAQEAGYQLCAEWIVKTDLTATIKPGHPYLVASRNENPDAPQVGAAVNFCEAAAQAGGEDGVWLMTGTVQAYYHGGPGCQFDCEVVHISGVHKRMKRLGSQMKRLAFKTAVAEMEKAVAQAQAQAEGKAATN